MLKKNVKHISANIYFLVGICTASGGFLLLIYPIISLLSLTVPTVYFLYTGNYKNVFIIWGFLLFIWYFAFMLCMLGYDSSIWIGGENTRLIYDYLIYKVLMSPSSTKWYAFMLDSFCFQTVMLLDSLSSILGFPLCIPSLIKGFISLVKFF